MLSWNVHKYLWQYLPPVLRKERLWRFIYALGYPIFWLWQKFAEWRQEQEYLLNISPTVLQLQEYLNDLYDTIDRRILVKHENINGLEVPLSSEGYDTVYIGLSDEADTLAAEIPLYGEAVEVLGTFLVLIPIGINPEAVRETVNKYKLIGKTFTVQTLN